LKTLSSEGVIMIVMNVLLNLRLPQIMDMCNLLDVEDDFIFRGRGRQDGGSGL